MKYFAVALAMMPGLVGMPALAAGNASYQDRYFQDRQFLGEAGGQKEMAPVRLAQQSKDALPAGRPHEQSVPSAAPPATTTRTTTSDKQEPMVKQMNKDAKEKLEKEGK